VDADDSHEAEFQPWRILRTLEEEGVDFVVIGGLAAYFMVRRCPRRTLTSFPFAMRRTSTDWLGH